MDPSGEMWGQEAVVMGSEKEGRCQEEEKRAHAVQTMAKIQRIIVWSRPPVVARQAVSGAAFISTNRRRHEVVDSGSMVKGSGITRVVRSEEEPQCRGERKR